MKSFFIWIIFIHQKFITLLDFGSCRFYPTCSEYAKINIKHNNIIQAILYSATRILKCNQYFDGGIDYPKISNSIISNNKYVLIDDIPKIRNTKAWLIYTDSRKKELYWISNFTTKN